MNLGLLAVVAVAVLLPSFSESRIVSKCELRDKLREKLKLSRRLEEGILATVICEVDRRSHLNTALVTVIGNRLTTTAMPTAPATTTIQPTSADSTTTQLTNTTATATTTTTTTTTTATSPDTTNSTISSVNTTLVSNGTGGGKRRKRDADSSSEEDERSSEEDHGSNMRPQSLGLYGLFQLSDKQFCDSGYRQSRNVCRTSCTAFTDDDITDDIACVIKTDYWRQILESPSRECRRISNYFRECK